LAPQASPSLHLPPQAHGGDRHRSPPLSGRPPWYGETPLEAHLLPPPSHDLTHELPSANAWHNQHLEWVSHITRRL
jgi:hypothetical protein